MKRADMAFGATVLLVSVIAAVALVSTAQAQPRSAAEVSGASVSSVEPVVVEATMPIAAVPADDDVTGTPPPEALTPAAGGTPVESADAAIAIALRDRASIRSATSTQAVKTSQEEAYGEDGLLAGGRFSPAVDSASTDGLWLVGVTGDIHNSFGALAVPLDWMIVVIDARTGSIVSTWGNTGTLPDIFD